MRLLGSGLDGLGEICHELFGGIYTYLPSNIKVAPEKTGDVLSNNTGAEQGSFDERIVLARTEFMLPHSNTRQQTLLVASTFATH